MEVRNQGRLFSRSYALMSATGPRSKMRCRSFSPIDSGAVFQTAFTYKRMRNRIGEHQAMCLARDSVAFA
jgi:hypothetical protein